MAKLLLTDRHVQSMRAPVGRREEIHDSVCPGLMLRVSANGARTWSLRYRAPNGRQVRHRIGEAAVMSLKDARMEAGRLKELVHRGGDPARERHELKEAARREAVATFDRLFEEYMEACESGAWQPKRKLKRRAVIEYELRLAERHILPTLGSVPHAQIRRSTIKALLRSMLAQGIGSQTNRVQAIVRQVFNYAISEELTEVNPATGFQAFHATQPRRRIWKDPELRMLWRALTQTSPLMTPEGREVQVGRMVRIALQLALLLLQRRNEIATMALEDIDLEQAVWVIPPERAKSGRPHQVPLPPLAVELIKEALLLTGLPSDRTVGPVFPSPREHTRPIEAEALTRGLDRIRDVIQIHDATVHDLRRTGSTILTSERLRVTPLIRSKVLGHGTETGGGALVSSVHYDVNEYVVDKRAALEAWQALLLNIVAGGAPATRPQFCLLRSTMFGLEAANDVSDQNVFALR